MATKKKVFTLNLKSVASIRTLRKTLLQSICKKWKTCTSWVYITTKPITDITKIKFTLKNKKHKYIEKPSIIYNQYIKKSKGHATSFYSPGGTLLVIPRKPFLNLTHFTLKAKPQQWVSLWKRVAKETKKMEKPFYISTHGHGVSHLHVRLEKKIKYK